MEYFKDVRWTGTRPTYEESQAGVYGVNADQSGIRMEVRILNTPEYGVHVAITVCDKDHLLMIKDHIPVIVAGFAQQPFEEGKRRAIALADKWLQLVR